MARHAWVMPRGTYQIPAGVLADLIMDAAGGDREMPVVLVQTAGVWCISTITREDGPPEAVVIDIRPS